MSEDHRLFAINTWVESILGTDSFTIAPASSDASFRRYFRVTLAESSWVVMDAPPEKEDTSPFIKIAQFLDLNQVHVPEIIAQDAEQGFLMLTDLGSTPYLKELNSNTADQLYRDAITGIVSMQRCDISELSLAHYSEQLLREELDLFPYWFLEQHFNIAPPSCLQSVFELLIDNALSQPQVFVHRDYHSRNLMITPTNNPGIIDFQDAVIGPITYDLVSLLKDSYIAWPEEKLVQWQQLYFSLAQEHKLIDSKTEFNAFQRWFDLMGLQRQLKILGIFCRLHYRDNKPNYMADLPQTIAYVRDVCARYDELAALNTFINQQPQLNRL